MSMNFNPLNGATIPFGTVAVGMSVGSTIHVSCGGDPDSDEEDFVQSVVITGPGAAQFSFSDTGGYELVLTPGFNGSGTLYFTPLSAAVFTATATVNYHLFKNGIGSDHSIAYTLTGTGTGSGVPAGEAAALQQSFRRELVPTLGTTGKVLSYFDETNFNDLADGAQYIFKAEDIAADRVPTVRRVILTYTDLGVATLTLRLTGVNDDGAQVAGALAVTIGTAGASGNLLTKFVDIQLTAFRPQLTITRAVAGGPVALSTILIVGTIERQVTL